MVDEGIHVAPALPVNPAGRLLAGLDLRNHRKLAVIDGRIGYTGSQNVVRPDYGNKVGDWRDLMVRLVGLSVSHFQAVILEDWEFEAEQAVNGEEYFPASVGEECIPL